MAKINWLFQDEVAENENRYKAINVATGEEITFDLLRGGNIQIVGTPLNAENLNSLIKAINDCYDEISKSEENTTYTLTKNGNAIRLTGSDNSTNDVTLNAKDVGAISTNQGVGNENKVLMTDSNGNVTNVSKLPSSVIPDTGVSVDSAKALELANGNLINADNVALDDDVDKSLYNLGEYDTIVDNGDGTSTITRKTGYLTIKPNMITGGTSSSTNSSGAYTIRIEDIDISNAKYQWDTNIGISNINFPVMALSSQWARPNNISINSNDEKSLVVIGFDSEKSQGEIQDLCPIIIQYELATPYEEKVITKQSLLNLDQNGIQFLRDEWEKQLNWINVPRQTISHSDLINSDSIYLEAGTYTFKLYFTSYSGAGQYALWVDDNTITGGESVNNAITFSVSTTGNHKIKCFVNGYFVELTAMLNKGSVAYPYKPYHGEIVRRKLQKALIWEGETGNFSINLSEGIYEIGVSTQLYAWYSKGIMSVTTRNGYTTGTCIISVKQVVNESTTRFTTVTYVDGKINSDSYHIRSIYKLFDY